MHYYIKKGEYKSQFPFGICKSKNEYFILSISNVEIGNYVIINKNLFEVIEIVDRNYLNFNNIDETIEIFLFTYFDFFFVNKLNFQKPFNI